MAHLTLSTYCKARLSAQALKLQNKLFIIYANSYSLSMK
ncbi:hypothetical protein PESP_a0271 [Pseudoalteromonas espejiana DSM 9414]|nr:hypothetical protein PESP_a0271 [Pseudoalteromonas espejiana DSM 9414]